jgi:hypothetical protein
MLFDASIKKMGGGGMKVYTRIEIDIETGKVLAEDSYEYQGSVALCGGGGASVPPMPKEQKELYALQKVALEKQMKEQDTLTPFLYKALGYKEVAGQGTQTENPEWIKWKAAQDTADSGAAQGAAIDPNEPSSFGGADWHAWRYRNPVTLSRFPEGNYLYSEVTPNPIRDSIPELPGQTGQLGTEPERYITTKPGEKTLVEMTMDEKLAAMSPAERASYQQSMRKMGLDVYGNKLTDEQYRAGMSPAELREEETQRAAYRSYMLSMGLNPDTGQKMTQEELLSGMTPLQRQQYQQQQAAYDAEMRAKGYDPVTGARMTAEQQIANMTAAQRLEYETSKLSSERYKQALEGKLPISPALEAQLKDEETTLRNELLQRLGQDYMLSTPGQKAIATLQQKHNMIREEARRGEISAGDLRTAREADTDLRRDALATGNYTSSLAEAIRKSSIDRAGLLPVAKEKAEEPVNQGMISNLANVSNRYSSVIGNAGAVLQPYERERTLQTQAAMQNAANSAAGTSGFFGMLGQGLGAFGTAAAYALFSTKKAKKDIDKVSDSDEDKILEMLADGNDTYSYRYKGEQENSPKRVGYMAEEAPPGVATPDKNMIDLGKLTGLHAAAIKALARKVEKLENHKGGS